MMPTGSFMDISKKGDSIFGRYAPLEDPCGAALVKFSLDYCEGLGASHNLSMVDGVLWQFSLYQVSQIWLRLDCFYEYDCGCFLRQVFCSRC
jgi:hypothetical protein